MEVKTYIATAGNGESKMFSAYSESEARQEASAWAADKSFLSSLSEL